jgi:nitrate reductase assembly molybdenum cofactor insertion protein NarJ
MLDLRKIKDDPNIKWDQRRRQGLIAQEVKETMDQLGLATDDFIGYNDETPDHLSLVYEQFIPVLIKSVQQQQSQIQDLLARIEQLESK